MDGAREHVSPAHPQVEIAGLQELLVHHLVERLQVLLLGAVCAQAVVQLAEAVAQAATAGADEELSRSGEAGVRGATGTAESEEEQREERVGA